MAHGNPRILSGVAILETFAKLEDKDAKLGGMKTMKFHKTSLSLAIIIFSFLSFNQVSAQQYCLDATAYYNFLCYEIRVSQACYAQKIFGPFSDLSTCENKRRMGVPAGGETGWYSRTRCIPCGSSSKPSSPSYQAPQQSEIHITIPPSNRGEGRWQMKFEATKEHYRKNLEQNYGEKAANEFDKMASELYKTCSNPVKALSELKNYYDGIARKYESMKNLQSSSKPSQIQSPTFQSQVSNKPQPTSGTQSSAVNPSLQSSSGSLLVSLSHSKPKVNLTDPWLYYITQQWNAKEIQGLVKNPPEWNTPEIVSKVNEWYKEKIKCEFIDYLTEKTKLPLDKLDKALSVGELMNEAVVKPVFDCLETTKSSLGNDEKMAQAAEKCINLVKGSKEIVEKEARKSIVEEFLGSIPNYGKLLGLFGSQGITTHNIIKENEQEVKKK